MKRGYLPTTDRGLADWTRNFIVILNDRRESLRIGPEYVEQLRDAMDEFNVAVREQQRAQILASSMTIGKRTKRAALVKTVRMLARWLKSDTTISDGLIMQLGLRSPSAGRPAGPVEMQAPLIRVEGRRGRVIVHFGKGPSKDRLYGKHPGAKGAYIYRKKAGEDGWQLLNFVTRSPYYDSIAGPVEDCAYMVRYVYGRKQGLGPESEPAVIAAGGLMAA
jgi:hypothetical protein